MPKRTINDFLSNDVENTLEKTSKKLSDIFEKNDRFQETSGDVHMQRIDWVTLMKDTCEVYTQRHIQKLKESKLTPIWKMFVCKIVIQFLFLQEYLFINYVFIVFLAGIPSRSPRHRRKAATLGCKRFTTRSTCWITNFSAPHSRSSFTKRSSLRVYVIFIVMNFRPTF